MATILSAITLPSTASDLRYNYDLDRFYNVYECNFISDSTCYIENLDHLNNAEFELLPVDKVRELKFVSCSFSNLSMTVPIRHGSDNYYLTSINLSENHIKSLTKFHFTVEDLLRADLSRNEIENLDTPSIFEEQSTLKKIDLSFNKITFIHSEAFKGLTELSELCLNNNEIKEINGFIFSPLYNLKILELSVNYIEAFENDTFSALVNLEKINLEKNDFFQFNFSILENNYQLRDISIGDFNSLENDGFMLLSGNSNVITNYNLTKVIESDFIANGSVIRINNSKISSLTIGSQSKMIFVKNSSITELICNNENSLLSEADFSKNLLTGDIKFENFKQLEILDLSFNQIKNISFVNSSRLIDLNLSNNNLTFIQTIKTLSNMKILDLSFNCFENLEIDTFADMYLLEILNLRQTCFQSLNYGSFSFQTNLRVLDISFNNLNNIDLNMLSSLTSLEDLFIDGNNLTEVQSIDLIGINLPNLRSIGLTNNIWNCKLLNSVVNKLNQLNVKIFVENPISNITNVKGIGCSATFLNSTHESFIVPQNPMPINHTAYMNKIEEINEIVKTVNEMNTNKKDRELLDNSFKKGILDLKHDKSVMESKFNDQVNQLKVFGKAIVNKFKILNEINFKKLMNMKVTVQILKETNNEKYNILSESIKSLDDKLQMIKFNDENGLENVNKVARSGIKVYSEHFDDIGTIKTLEICLIILLLVLVIVALYYAVVYC